jgi:benzoate-CoA ligase
MPDDARLRIRGLSVPTGAESVRGIMLILSAYLVITGADVAVKWALPEVGVAVSMIARGVIGAAAVLIEKATPEALLPAIEKFGATVCVTAPTSYRAMAAQAAMHDLRSLRKCVSAGEALPAATRMLWKDTTGITLIDGIGSTEMLHIFLSNRSGDVRYGTTGKPVAGYQIRLVGDDGHEALPGELGELQICGPTSALLYWNNRQRTQDTFVGPWTRAGDKYSVDADGYYVYGGRSDDMLKVSGQYVSPFEVEGALASHPQVLEAAVVGAEDEEGLIKPKAFVVLQADAVADDALDAELKAHVKRQLAPHNYPRWIEFVPDLPKTATGKIQRFKLRS